MGDWGEDKRHGFGSLAILDAQEIRKEERRSIENMMSRCFTWFLLSENAISVVPDSLF